LIAVNSFYWHDYETWGADPRRDRPAQFAGMRTDLELNPIGEPLVLYCRPPEDQLPQPEACLITGITPQKARAEGLREADFIARIHQELAWPGTCGVGYNSIRFDDEVTRFTLYRNFFDPYAREWQNGNSRWDIIDMARLTRALRPQGIRWPDHPDGRPSFRLEDLTCANGIGHEAAHDALSDVHATIAVARLIRRHQPRLYDYLYRTRGKRRAAELLNPRRPRPLVHASARYPAEYCGTAVVAPLLRDPVNPQGVVVYDLRHDPRPFLGLSAAQLQARLFTPTAQLSEGEPRLPVKTVRVNHCPVLAPIGTLDAEAARRLDIDTRAAERHLRLLLGSPELGERIGQALQLGELQPPGDVDQALYQGGFFSDGDRRRIEQVRQSAPERLGQLRLGFEDPRLEELLFRYRSRNWPETLGPPERERWQAFRRKRIFQPEGTIGYADFCERLEQLRSDAGLVAQGRALLDRLEEHARELAADLEPAP